MTVITASPKGFQKLLDLQEQSLGQLSTMKTLMEAAVLENFMDMRLDQQQVDLAAQSLDVEQRQFEMLKDQADAAKKAAHEQAKAFAEISKGMKTFKTVGDRINDIKRTFSDAFGGGSLADTLMKSMNVGGVFDKKLARNQFIKQQEAIEGPGGRSKKDLKKDYDIAQGLSKQIANTDADIEKLKALIGNGKPVSDDQLRNTTKGKQLLENRDSMSGEYAKVDKSAVLLAGTSAPLPMTPSDSGKVAKSTSTKALESGQAKEDKNEMLKVLGDQTSLLQQIATNTGGGGNASSAGGGEDKGGGGKGIMAGIGAGLKSLGGGLAGLGRGAGRGIQGLLQGIASGLAAMANPATLIGLAAVTLSVMGIGKALQWAAPAIESFSKVLIKVADVIGNVFMTGIKMIPDVIRSIGDVITNVIGAISDAIVTVLDSVVGSIERLANIDGKNLLSVGAGLLAVSGGLIAFAAANVAAGIGNLVTGFLGAVSGGSPIDQLERLANMSDGLMNAATGIQAIADAMQGFSKIDPKSMQAINDFPWIRATAFVAAGGGMMMSNGSKIYNASKGNADESAKVEASNAGGGSTTAVVNAPVQTNNNTTQIVKPNVRNQESSQSRYLGARY